MKSPLAATAVAFTLLAPFAAWSNVSISIGIQPPPLPIYVQPPVPGDGYLWTPGYWGWSPSESEYFWIPGTWVLAPTPGYLWTPGYWGFYGGGYRWNMGYWATHVGFYGGINYGFGYVGSGYYGGRWDRGVFHYNSDVNNVNKLVVRNVYNTKVVNNYYNVKRVSYNGGPDGVIAKPGPKEIQMQNQKRIDATPNQVEHERTAMKTPTQKASVNHGAPQVAATGKPSAFTDKDATPATNEKDTARQAKMDARGEAQKSDPARPDAESNATKRQSESRDKSDEKKAARGGEKETQPAPNGKDAGRKPSGNAKVDAQAAPQKSDPARPDAESNAAKRPPESRDKTPEKNAARSGEKQAQPAPAADQRDQPATERPAQGQNKAKASPQPQPEDTAQQRDARAESKGKDKDKL